MNTLTFSLVLVCLSVVRPTTENLCIDSNIEEVGRVVFGEARGESAKGQLAVAWTIVNRVNHAGYPNTLSGVIYQTYGERKLHQYNTLDVPSHTTEWNHARATKSDTYNNAIHAARGALCKEQADPTKCATDYCAYDPCSATRSNCFWSATHKKQIGNHYFVCREATSC